MLDTLREVYTPEGVALRLPAAGPLPRALAWSIDAAIRATILMILAFPLMLLGRTGVGLQLVLLFVTVWVYPVLFEVLYDGQTPGKRVMGLRVIREDGAPVGWQASIVRNLLRTVDMLPFGYAVGLLTSLFDAAGRRLGDIVAGTLVIHANTTTRTKPSVRTRSAAASKPSATPEVPAIPAPAPARAPLAMLLPYEQAAVVAFSERAASLTPERQAELAAIAVDAVGDAPARGRVERLQGVAAYLLGR